MSQQPSAHDFWQYQQRPLDEIFRPNAVAVIGATEREGSVGRTLLWNLMTSTFGGTIYPINPKRKNVLGIRAYPSIADVPEKVDLAVIIVPATQVPDVTRQCVAKGVKGAIIISAGFKEIGERGIRLEAEVLEIARQGNLRIVGPNCVGVMSPTTGLNATFAQRMAPVGSVGFISQSGAMCTAILDWSWSENVGFSHFVSVGSMLDVDWGDLIYYMGDDPRTKSIVIYMETVGDARAFLSAAREVALIKPIIVIKPGRTEEAAKAAASHTGSLTGSDEVLDAAFRRAGVLRVERISELFNMAEILSKQPLPTGPQLVVVTNAGGPGVLTTDALLSSGAQLATLSAETQTALDQLLPPHWSHSNPVDILGDANSQTYAKTIEIVGKEPNADGLLVILTPQAMTNPTQVAELLRNHQQLTQGKPLLASWMGGSDVAAGRSLLNQAGVPTFPYPDMAARMFGYMWQFRKNLNSLYETPRWAGDNNPDREGATAMLEYVRQSGRTILTEYESKKLLKAYGIPTVRTELAHSADSAVQIAQEMGYPVVVKLNSETITHKTDVGGVQLNLQSADAVRHAYELIERNVLAKHHSADFGGVTVQPMVQMKDAYELILGATPDSQFGPVLLFGTGGILVEVFRDRALDLPPLNANMARRMMRRTKIYQALEGVRGRAPVNLAQLEEVMVSFSYLVAEQPWIKEIDINPVLAGPEGIIALDARVLVYDQTVSADQLPKLAVRPYPVQYEQVWQTKTGQEMGIRPIRPEDEPMMIDFHRRLSEKSIYMRYFGAMNFNTRTAHDRLIRVCHVDYDRDMALVVTRQLEDKSHEIVAAGRLTKLHNENAAEFSMLIADAYQRDGIGTKILAELVRIGRDDGLERIIAHILPSNTGMIRVSEKLGFRVRPHDDLMEAVLKLK